MAVWWWVAIVGYIIGLTTMSVAGRYAALFMMTSGFTGIMSPRCGLLLSYIYVSPAYPIIFVWVPNAIPRPPAKRSAAIGLVNGLGSLGLL